MKGSDKILISIVVGIIILVIVALVVTIARPEPTYQPEDTPEGVVHNYLLAMQDKDYERAYGYLSPTLSNYPASVEEFRDEVNAYGWMDARESSTTFAIVSARTTSTASAVSVRETYFRQTSLFDSGNDTFVFEVELILEGNEWKITFSKEYFNWRWIEE